MEFLKTSADFKISKSFQHWDSLTAKFSGASNIPFLFLQLPQILLNARNLLAGNKAALLAVPWLVKIIAALFFPFTLPSFACLECDGVKVEIKLDISRALSFLPNQIESLAVVLFFLGLVG